jgi:hypothetical protein
MQKEILLYPEAQELQQLGFDEICFGYYRSVLGKPEVELIIRQTPPRFYHLMTIPEHFDVLAPTYSQAFEFFEEKFKLFPTLHVDQTMEPKFGYSIAEFFEDEGGFFDWKNIMSSYLYYTRQESKLECLRELIKIAKNRKQ